MAKVSGIKGINISKASVLKDGEKKSSTNDSFRDTSNGTTRDNSNSNALDAAMIKMLLGQTELMAKKASQIELNMRIAQQKEEDRQRKLEEYAKEKAKREEEREQTKKEAETKRREASFNKGIDSLDKGVVNGMLSSFLGPAGVMLGKGLNAVGLPVDKLIKKGLFKTTNLLRNTTNSVFGWMAKKFDGGEGGGEGGSGENALSVNRREEAAKPINDFKHTVVGYMKKIIGLMGGKGGKGDGENKTDWFKRLLASIVPLALGYLFGYQPLKEFGVKFFYKMLQKPIEFMARSVIKIGQMLWHAPSTIAKWATKVGEWFTKGGTKAAEKATEQGAKTAAKSAATTAATKGMSKGAETLAKGAGKVGAEQAAKTAAKSAGKMGLWQMLKKGGSKMLLKKIPLIGAAMGLGLGIKRWVDGDFWGGLMEIGSGLASTIPLVGTGASIAMDAAILARDINRDLNGVNTVKSEPSAAATVTPTPIKSEGTYSTSQSPQRTFLEEGRESNREILETLKQIEMNLNPDIQRSLDMSYVNDIKREFTAAPELAPNSFNEYPSLNVSWSERWQENMNKRD